MRQTTKDAARKAISFLQGEVDPQRLTGGSLPGGSGLVVAIKPAHAAVATGAGLLVNGNGSYGGVQAAEGKAARSPLEALLVVADEGADEASIMREVASGEAIGPAGDLVGERTRARILSWKVAETDENGAMSDRYILSVAASLIDHPLSELLGDGNVKEPEPGDTPKGATDDEATGEEASGADTPGGHNSGEDLPAEELPSADAADSQADIESQARPEAPHEHVPQGFSNVEVHTFPAETVGAASRQSEPKPESEQEPESRPESRPGQEPEPEPETNIMLGPETDQDPEPGSEQEPVQDPSRGGGMDTLQQATEQPDEQSREQRETEEEREADTETEPDDGVDSGAGSTNIPAAATPVEAEHYPATLDGHDRPPQGQHREPQSGSPRTATRESQPGPEPAPEHAEPAAHEERQPAEEEEEPEWASELASGKTHTPEQRAYLIARETAKKRSLRHLRRRREPEPPAGLSTVQNLQDEAIRVLATAPEGPGIVTPLISKGGTGKTTVAVELAFTFARMMGSNGDSRNTGRVLLVDQNLTNPDLANRVAVEGAGRKGVKNLLEGDELHRVVARTALPNLDALFLLGKGDRDLESVQRALSHQRTMETVIDTLATGTGEYDIIVVDTANTLPAQKDNPASYAMTMWASIADARYLVLQPETASFKNATWFASAMSDALSEGQYLTAVMNCFPQKRVYEEAPITAELARKRKAALGALQELEQSPDYPVGPAISARGRPLQTPLVVPDYPEEVRGFAAEGRPISMFSQTFADAYKRIAMDAIRRMLAARMNLK